MDMTARLPSCFIDLPGLHGSKGASSQSTQNKWLGLLVLCEYSRGQGSGFKMFSNRKEIVMSNHGLLISEGDYEPHREKSVDPRAFVTERKNEKLKMKPGFWSCPCPSFVSGTVPLFPGVPSTPPLWRVPSPLCLHGATCWVLESKFWVHLCPCNSLSITLNIYVLEPQSFHP